MPGTGKGCGIEMLLRQGPANIWDGRAITQRISNKSNVCIGKFELFSRI